MCGIGGVIRYGKEAIPEEMVSLLLMRNEHRGNDASGIAIAKFDGTLAVCKRDVQPWKFVASDEYKEFVSANLTEDAWGVIVHARAATTGNPRDNNNNHPLYAGKSAIIHNGMINNHAWLFGARHLERNAATDSDILRAFVDEYGITPRCVKEADALSGSVACAAFSPEHAQKLLLMRSGSPVCLASTEDYFLFASEKDTLHRALRPFVKRFGMWFQIQRPNAAYSKMADNTAWIVGPEGLEWHGEFKSCFHYSEPNRRVYDGFKSRQAGFTNTASTKKEDKEEKDEAWCSHCNRKWIITKGEDPTTFFCPKGKLKGCGRPLSKVPLVVIH